MLLSRVEKPRTDSRINPTITRTRAVNTIITTMGTIKKIIIITTMTDIITIIIVRSILMETMKTGNTRGKTITIEQPKTQGRRK